MPIRIVGTRRFRCSAAGDGLHPRGLVPPRPGSVWECAYPRGRFGYDDRWEEEMPERLCRIHGFQGSADGHDGLSTRRLAPTANSDEAFPLPPGRSRGDAPSERSGAFLSVLGDF